MPGYKNDIAYSADCDDIHNIVIKKHQNPPNRYCYASKSMYHLRFSFTCIANVWINKGMWYALTILPESKDLIIKLQCIFDMIIIGLNKYCETPAFDLIFTSLVTLSIWWKHLTLVRPLHIRHLFE